MSDAATAAARERSASRAIPEPSSYRCRVLRTPPCGGLRLALRPWVLSMYTGLQREGRDL